jgi:hypothetical protein
MSETADVLVLIREGKELVCIQGPTELDGRGLRDLLVSKGILHATANSNELREAVGAFLKNVPVTVDALYVAEHGPFLVMFDVKTTTTDKAGDEMGVIAGLTGDRELEALFVATDASVRVLCSSRKGFEALRRYAAELAARKTEV